MFVERLGKSVTKIEKIKCQNNRAMHHVWRNLVNLCENKCTWKLLGMYCTWKWKSIHQCIAFPTIIVICKYEILILHTLFCLFKSKTVLRKFIFYLSILGSFSNGPDFNILSEREIFNRLMYPNSSDLSVILLTLSRWTRFLYRRK